MRGFTYVYGRDHGNVGLWWVSELGRRHDVPTRDESCSSSSGTGRTKTGHKEEELDMDDGHWGLQYESSVCK